MSSARQWIDGRMSNSGHEPGRRLRRDRMMDAIRLICIVKSFGRANVLCGVSMDIRHGEVMGLVGQAGSGKTTLLRIAAGLVPPDCGRVLVDGGARRRTGCG